MSHKVYGAAEIQDDDWMFGFWQNGVFVLLGWAKKYEQAEKAHEVYMRTLGYRVSHRHKTLYKALTGVFVYLYDTNDNRPDLDARLYQYNSHIIDHTQIKIIPSRQLLRGLILEDSSNQVNVAIAIDDWFMSRYGADIDTLLELVQDIKFAHCCAIGYPPALTGIEYSVKIMDRAEDMSIVGTRFTLRELAEMPRIIAGQGRPNIFNNDRGLYCLLSPVVDIIDALVVHTQQLL